MAIRSLLDTVTSEVASAATGAASTKITETGNRVAEITGGGWSSFVRLVSGGVDASVSTAAQITQRAELIAGGVAPADVDEMIRQMSPAQFGTALSTYSGTAEVQRVIEADVTAAQMKVAIGASGENDGLHKVKLIERNTANRDVMVVFDIMPEVVESRTVEYEAVAPPQSPTAFQKYKGTSSVQWTINATLVCRNTAEATNNLRIINILRGWTMPFFGDNTNAAFPNKLGAPPPVLEFSGWKSQMVGPVKVVITSLNWNFPQDVDYIPARSFTTAYPSNEATAGSELIPFPTVIKLAINVVESFSTDEVNAFDLAAFRDGRMDLAFQSARVVSEANVSRGSAPEPQEAQTQTATGPDASDRPPPQVTPQETGVTSTNDGANPVTVSSETFTTQPDGTAPVSPTQQNTSSSTVIQLQELLTEIDAGQARVRAARQQLDITYSTFVQAQVEGRDELLPTLEESFIKAQEIVRIEEALQQIRIEQYELLTS